MLWLEEKLTVMAKTTYRRFVIKMGMAQNYLPTAVQKMIPKPLPVKCAERRADPYAVVCAARLAEARADIRADFCAEKNGTDANRFIDAEPYADVRAVPPAEHRADAFADRCAERCAETFCRNNCTDAEHRAVPRADAGAYLRAEVRAELFAVK